MNKLLNNLLGMYKQAKLNKKAESYKSKVAEMLNDINEPSPIMDYISESEAEEICKEIGIPHEASWYKGDLFGYIDEVPEGMVDVLIEHISEEDAESLWRRIAHDMGMDVDAKKQTKMSKKAQEKESAKKDYTEQYAKVKEIMKEYGYGLSDGGYIYLISKEQPKDEGFQVKFKGDRLRVELDGKLTYSGYGPEAIEDFLKGMFYAKKLSFKAKSMRKRAKNYKEYIWHFNDIMQDALFDNKGDFAKAVEYLLTFASSEYDKARFPREEVYKLVKEYIDDTVKFQEMINHPIKEEYITKAKELLNNYKVENKIATKTNKLTKLSEEDLNKEYKLLDKAVLKINDVGLVYWGFI